MNDKKKAPDTVERVEDYAIEAVRLFEHLEAERSRAGWIVGRPYVRSATSTGANVEEAQAAESRADFVHEYAIAQKEARGSRYWLRLLARADLAAPERVGPLLQETEELYAIIAAIIRRAKRP